jgi:hypothetical protein
MSTAEMLDKGIVRATTIPNYVDQQEGTFNLTTRGEQLIAQAVPERMELSRLGAGVVIRTAAAVTLNQALPTTTATAYIWNGESPGGKHYVIDKISWCCTTTSGGAANFYQIVVCVGRASVSQPATADTLIAASLNGKRYGGRAGMGHTATIADDYWFPVGSSVNTAALTATKGVNVEAAINGAIIIPPGCLLSLDCVGTAATASGQFYVTLYEVQLTNVIS